MNNSIPTIIHQIWFQGLNIPDSYPNYSDSWKKYHPNYKYILWDKKMIDELIRNNYPQYYDTYLDLKHMVQKIDMAKYIILYHYGGIYVDMDCECLKSVDNFIKGKQVILAKLYLNSFEKLLIFGLDYAFDDVIQNGIMFSTKEHPFFKNLVDNIVSVDKTKYLFETDINYIFRTTGPGLLTKCYYSYNKNDIYIDNSKIVDPVGFCENCICYPDCSSYCTKHYPDAITLHHFGSINSDYGWMDNLNRYIAISVCFLQRNLYIVGISSMLLLSIICILMLNFTKKLKIKLTDRASKFGILSSI